MTQYDRLTHPQTPTDAGIRPNILVLMVDQLAGTFFPDGAPAPFLHVPNLRALAARSARFANAYCASPLCAPSRASFMSGLLPSHSHAYDNAAEFPADTPTFVHHLRRAGYRTALSGKMHFIGPDQLHGFEERLTTDIYPADYGWTPDYENPDTRIDWWYHNLGSVTAAGTAETTNQLEYDDETAFLATAKLRDLARGHDPRPWCVTVSFTHPHDPYVARPAFWDLYEDCPALDPETGPIPYEEQSLHDRRLMRAADFAASEITPEDVRRARRAYFANVSYVDALIGELLAVLDATGMADNTAILFTSDHGDMLGERGLWFKMSFREPSARVPLLLAAPGVAPARVDTPVSLLDVLPTLAEIAGADIAGLPADGESLLPVAGGAARGPVPMEYAAEGSAAPLVALREGRWKITVSDATPPTLHDLETDPREEIDLAAEPAHADTLARLLGLVRRRWDLAAFDRAVRASQTRRRVVYEALRAGAYTPWDHQPCRPASERFMRNHMDLNVLESRQRFPRP
jgi:choline-sulfatase